MANEITLTARLRFQDGDLDDEVRVDGLQVSVSGSIMFHNVQSVATTQEALSLGDAGTGGYVMLVNRDATNFVEVRQATGASDLIRLKAGEVALFRLSPDATAPFVIADTASCNLEVFLIAA